MTSTEDARTPRSHHNSLYDDEAWTDAEGTTWLLEEMDPSHQRNLLAMLIRRARSLQDAEVWSCYMYSGGDIAECAGDEIAAMDPLDWLNEQPLVQRLRELCG